MLVFSALSIEFIDLFNITILTVQYWNTPFALFFSFTMTTPEPTSSLVKYPPEPTSTTRSVFDEPATASVESCTTTTTACHV